jgi:hypothetical protein
VTADADRLEHLAVLIAIEAALDDPVRLAHVLAEADDDRDAVGRVTATFGVDERQALALLDLQFGRLTRAHRARLADELRVLRADWGPPVEGELVLTGRRTAVLSAEGTTRRLTARTLAALLDEVVALVRTTIAAPRLRPVVLTVTGATKGLAGVTVRPDGSASFDHHEDGGRPA